MNTLLLSGWENLALALTGKIGAKSLDLLKNMTWTGDIGASMATSKFIFQTICYCENNLGIFCWMLKKEKEKNTMPADRGKEKS